MLGVYNTKSHHLNVRTLLSNANVLSSDFMNQLPMCTLSAFISSPFNDHSLSLEHLCSLLCLLVAVQSFSHVWLSVIPWIAAHQASLCFSISWSLLKLMSFESVMLSNHFILCFPLPLLPSIFPGIKAFSKESTLHIRWPEYWSLSFSISPSNEYSGLISFRIDWFDLLAVQGTLKNLLQHYNLKIRSHHSFHCFPSICHEVMGMLVFWMLNFKPVSSLSSFTFIKRLFSSSLLSVIMGVSSVYLRLWIFLPAILFPDCESSSLAFHMMY